jgi:hypothetical protein
LRVGIKGGRRGEGDTAHPLRRSRDSARVKPDVRHSGLKRCL